jgi:dephospho-CoA kinase
MPILVTITGPVAAGKNTVADLLAEHCVSTVEPWSSPMSTMWPRW